MSERAGRYQRSIPGGIGALIVTLAAVVAFVLVRSLARDNAAVEPEPVDYRETVAIAQREGAEIVYPRSLPEGWVATSVELTPGERPAWGMGMLTDDGRFAGIRQESSSITELLRVYVDEDAAPEGTERLDGPVPTPWQVYEDTGGDTAFAVEVGDQMLLVYGSADAASLREIIAVLTSDPL